MNTLQFAKQLRRNQTSTEGRLWYQLRNRQLSGFKFKRQWPIGSYIVDFICLTKKVIVELDGGQHNSSQTQEYDFQRTKLLKEKGYTVLRFWDNEVNENMTGVLEKILEILRTSP